MTIKWLLIAGIVSSLPVHRTSDAEPPAAGAPVAQLIVGGEVEKPLTLSAEGLKTLPRQTVRAKSHDGPVVAYEGVPLFEILQAAGVKFGKDLRGPALARYLVVEAADGYKAVFALPELDPASTDAVVLLADHGDGKPFDAKEGPLRLVLPAEKRHSRWVRQVVKLTIKRG